MARAKAPRPQALPRFRVRAGTPNEMEQADYPSPSGAKGWLASRMKDRRKWGDRYAHPVRDQMQSALEQLDSLNLTDAKPGREWEWRAYDEVSGLHFVFQLEVIG